MREFTIFFDYFYNTEHNDRNLINLVRLNDYLVDEGVLDSTRYYFYDEVVNDIIRELKKIQNRSDDDNTFNDIDMGDMARIARAIEERCPNAKSCVYHKVRDGVWYRCHDDSIIKEILYRSIFDACCNNYEMELKVRRYTKLMIDCNKMTIF